MSIPLFILKILLLLPVLLKILFHSKKPRNILITSFLESFYDYYTNHHSFLQAYKDHLAYINQTVRILHPQKEYKGMILGVDDSFRLVIKKEDGSIDHLSSGEISIRL